MDERIVVGMIIAAGLALAWAIVKNMQAAARRRVILARLEEEQ